MCAWPMKLAVILFAYTLVVPAWVSCFAGWRVAVEAWWFFGRYMLALYALAALTWIGMSV